MSSIAYVTDYKMLDNLRLNEKKTMNFWRLSTKTNFTDFREGDLLFFLSKNKDHFSSKKEKGIIGFGRVASMHIGSVKAMWNKYKELNGFNTYPDFKEAIVKVSKDHCLPNKITSFYLVDVSFFQNPLYLSEFGLNISKNIESYVYLKNDVVINLLEAAKNNMDLWTSDAFYDYRISLEISAIKINDAYQKMGSDNLPLSKQQSIRKLMQKLIQDRHGYRMVVGSYSDVYIVNNNVITFVFYKDKNTDIKYLLGKALLYKYYLNEYELKFKTIDNDSLFLNIINKTL